MAELVAEAAVTAAGQARGAPFAGPRRKIKPPQSGVGGMSPGNRPWPGITEPDCYECSWAYRGRWPFGRMEVKYLNAMCRVRAHRQHGVEEVAGDLG